MNRAAFEGKSPLSDLEGSPSLNKLVNHHHESTTTNHKEVAARISGAGEICKVSLVKLYEEQTEISRG